MRRRSSNRWSTVTCPRHTAWGCTGRVTQPHGRRCPQNAPSPPCSAAGAPGQVSSVNPGGAGTRQQPGRWGRRSRERSRHPACGRGVLTIHAGGSRPRRPCHLPREAGAFHRLGALLDLVLIAAPVSRNDFARARLYVHCGRRNSHCHGGLCPGAPRPPPAHRPRPQSRHWEGPARAARSRPPALAPGLAMVRHVAQPSAPPAPLYEHRSCPRPPASELLLLAARTPLQPTRQHEWPFATAKPRALVK